MDTEYILSKLPEYQAVQQKLDQMVRDWQAELDRRRQEIDRMFEEYQTRELLYTPEERQRRREEIVRAEEELERCGNSTSDRKGSCFASRRPCCVPSRSGCWRRSRPWPVMKGTTMCSTKPQPPCCCMPHRNMT